MKIEEGKFYRTRGGWKVGPMRRLQPDSGPDYWICETTAITCAKHGQYFVDEVTLNDLVAEWTDDQPTAQPDPVALVREMREALKSLSMTVDAEKARGIARAALARADAFLEGRP